MNQDITLGAGKVYFAEDSAGAMSVLERYMGDTPSFGLAVETTNLEVFDSDQAIAEQLVSVGTQIGRSIELTCRNPDYDNLAAFVIAGYSDKSGSGAALGTVSITSAVLDRWIQLGATASNPSGARDISNVVVTVDPTGTPSTAVEGTDYEVDAALGRVKLLSGGSIAAGDTVEIDATEGSTTRTSLVSNADGAKTGQLRFIADNTKGPNKDVYIPKVQLRPNGTLQWKSRDNVAEMGFSVSIQPRDGYEMVYIDGRAA